jgi:hypothetical protein
MTRKERFMKTGNFFAAAFALVFGSGCADHMDGADEAALRQDLASARTELTRHHQAVISAVSLDGALADVDRHDEQMTDIMDGMSTTTQDMSHCSGSVMSDMYQMMDGVDSDMRSHRETMTAAGTLEDARAMCTAHLESMAGMFDGMQRAIDQMGCMSSR